MGALPLPPYSALRSAAAPRPCPPLPAVNVRRRARHAGSWSPFASAVAGGARQKDHDSRQAVRVPARGSREGQNPGGWVLE